VSLQRQTQIFSCLLHGSARWQICGAINLGRFTIRLTAIVCPDTDIDTRILRYSASRILPIAATLIGELTFYRYCSGTMQICAPKNGSPDIMTRGEHSLCVSPKANSNIFVFAARLCALTDLRGNKSRSVYYIYIDIYIYSPTPTPTHYKFLSQYLSGNV